MVCLKVRRLTSLISNLFVLVIQMIGIAILHGVAPCRHPDFVPDRFPWRFRVVKPVAIEESVNTVVDI
jgi:hypothetical protein